MPGFSGTSPTSRTGPPGPSGALLGVTVELGERRSSREADLGQEDIKEVSTVHRAGGPDGPLRIKAGHIHVTTSSGVGLGVRLGRPRSRQGQEYVPPQLGQQGLPAVGG